MKIAGDYRFEAAVREVWDALFDPAVLAAVMPGCEKLERVGGQFVGEIKVKVGPVSGTFAGKVDLKDIDEPRRYTMVVDGRGSAGFVKATAVVELEADGDGTKMRYHADAQVGGKLASVGERLIDASTRAIVKEALAGLHTNVKIRAAAYKEAAQATAAEAAAESKPTSELESAPEPVSELSEPVSAPEPVSGSGSRSGSEPEPESKPDPEPEATPAPTPASAPSTPAPSPAPAPQIEYAKVTQAQMAASVAKEVGRSMWPVFLLAALVIAALIYLLVR